MAMERFFPSDFSKRDIINEEKLSNLPSEGWPFNYEDILEYYIRSEKLYSVKGGVDKLKEDYQFGYQDPPKINYSNNKIFKYLQKIGLNPYILPRASKFNKDSLENISLEDWNRMMAVNFRAPFILAQLMKKEFKKKSIGKIINIGDWRTSRKKRFSYGVSKAALSGLTRSLAISMAPNIQVNEIALGAILSPSDSKEPVNINLGPSNRPGTLDEVYSSIISLINNDFITGERITIDGGLHLT